MTSWWYDDGIRERGPVDADSLAQLVRGGGLTRWTRLRPDGGEDWTTAGAALPELFESPEAEFSGSGWRETAPHPWRRYAARMVDNTLVGGVTWFLIGVVSGIVAPGSMEALAGTLKGPGGKLVDALLTLAAALPGNALIVGLTGLSIGKWIFGVRVLRDGRPIGFPAALSREVEIWWRALACGLPLISLFTLWSQFERLSKAKPSTPWDERRKILVTYRPETTASLIWMWATVVILVGLVLWSRLSALR